MWCICQDIGAKAGKYHSINFPLREGIDDLSYEHIFKPVITAVMAKFRPGTIVLQCGADSLTGDRLGCFNLTLKGAQCLVAPPAMFLSLTSRRATQAMRSASSS